MVSDLMPLPFSLFLDMLISIGHMPQEFSQIALNILFKVVAALAICEITGRSYCMLQQRLACSLYENTFLGKPAMIKD